MRVRFWAGDAKSTAVGSKCIDQQLVMRGTVVMEARKRCRPHERELGWV